MWEAIRSNRRRSWVLLAAMALVLATLGYLIGAAFDPKGGPFLGLAAAGGLWLLLWLVAISQGDALFLAAAGAHRVEREDAPQLCNVVEEMAIASGIGRPPEVYVISDPVPNAFAVGLAPERGKVAVTTGLLRLCNRDELQGVVGHEIGHLRNRDTRFMVLAGVMLGAIVLLADGLRRVMSYGGGTGRRRSGKGGQAQVILLVLALVFAILAPILAEILYLACSRRREYLADASSALFTRYPEGLASALEKMSARMHEAGKRGVNRVLAPMYIVPSRLLAAMGVLSTHPPTEKRVKILRAMGGGAGYVNYEEAYRKVTGRGVLGTRTLAEARPVATRPPSAGPEGREKAVERSRDVVQLLGRLDHMLVMTCACGLGIHVPVGLARDAIPCPRCGREAPVPRAQDKRYPRSGKGWESFRCSCGRAIQLSPSFSAPFVQCDGCGTQVEVVSKT